MTDANVLLGYLNPRELAGGALQLHPDRARAAMGQIANALGIEVDRAAHGVFVVANAAMIRAIKAVTTYRGRDPRDFALLAFGGGGPLHAVALAHELGITRVIVPPNPGVFSAFGLLQAPPEAHTVQTFVRRTAGLDPIEPESIYRRLEDRARAMLLHDGYRAEEIALSRHADLRYVGQAYELSVSLGDGDLTSEEIDTIEERFAAEHYRVYGHRAEREPIELVNLRVVGRVAVHSSPLGAGAPGPRGEPRRSNREQRNVYFPTGWISTPVVERADLAGRPADGPLIVEDYDSTTVVPPGCRVRLDTSGCLFVEAAGAR